MLKTKYGKILMISWGIFAVFTSLFFYFLTTKTGIKLFVQTTDAQGQSTSYGVDIIKFDTTVSVGVKNANPNAYNITNTDNNTQGNIGLVNDAISIDKPLSIKDSNFQIDYGARTVGSDSVTSLWATKDNGASWTNLFSAGKIGVPVKYGDFDVVHQLSADSFVSAYSNRSTVNWGHTLSLYAGRSAACSEYFLSDSVSTPGTNSLSAYLPKGWYFKLWSNQIPGEERFYYIQTIGD